MFAHGARGRLTHHDRDRFPGETLHDRLGRAVCEAGCLPRKELYEAWEVARRCRRLFRGGRVVDVAAGHGLLAHVMILLDDTSPLAVAVDTQRPPCADRLAGVLVRQWPRLAGRVERRDLPLAAIDLGPDDVVVASHACGALTDEVITRGLAARARLALLPCCHDRTTCDAGPLTGWLEASLAIDVRRAARLEAAGYRVWTQTIDPAITPKHRLLLAAPRSRVPEE